MRKLLAAIGLVMRFVRAVFSSGLQTVAAILKAAAPHGQAPQGALVRVAFTPMSEAGAALLGCMVSLTPGTTTIDIDMQRHELLLHVLDKSDIAAMVAGMRRDFEPGLLAWFGTGDGR